MSLNYSCQPQALWRNSASPKLFAFRASDTSVTANVMIGIGNKPFLRGEGPSLSWDKGVPMSFVEIGKMGMVSVQQDRLTRRSALQQRRASRSKRATQGLPRSKVEITPEFDD